VLLDLVEYRLSLLALLSLRLLAEQPKHKLLEACGLEESLYVRHLWLSNCSDHGLCCLCAPAQLLPAANLAALC
jgi:hypothetical protein